MDCQKFFSSPFLGFFDKGHSSLSYYRVLGAKELFEIITTQATPKNAEKAT
jgi:hypothetical protein